MEGMRSKEGERDSLGKERKRVPNQLGVRAALESVEEPPF
jgi:hypothetical protein